MGLDPSVVLQGEIVSGTTSEASEAGGAQDHGLIKSAARVMEIFEFFAERQRAVTVAEVVEALGYPQSSTSGLLRTLTRLRYLEYNRYTRHYVPTLRIALIGGWIHDQMFSEVSMQHLVATLHERTGATVILGMQNDIYAQYIYLLQEDPAVVRWYIKPGSLRPLARSAIGRVLLSRKSDLEAVYLLRRINAAEENPGARMPESDLVRELDEIRVRGFAYTEGTVTRGAGVIAKILPTPASQPHMAIGIGTRIEVLRKRRDEFAAMLDEALCAFHIR